MAELHQPHAQHGAAGENPAVHYEQSDANVAGIFAFGVGLVTVAIVIHLMVWVLFRFFDARASRPAAVEYPLGLQQENRVPPEPRLQTNPREDLRQLRADEDEILSTYGWVDRNGGFVRIPIDEAFRLTLQRGLPARQER